MLCGRPRSRTQVEIVSDECFEEAAGVAGCVEHDGPGGFDLPHRGLPPVIGVAILALEGFDEYCDHAGAKPVADSLQHGGIVGGGESVGQLGEPDPSPPGLLLGPFVTVEPDLGRIRKIRADLDERRTEVDVPQVEVVDIQPPVGLHERPRGVARRGGAFVGGPCPLKLLSHADGCHS
jgi:hypothetical protein